MAFFLRETAHPDAAFIAAGESARSLVQNDNETDETYWRRVGRAAVDAYRSAANPDADAKRVLNLLMPFAESTERNREFAAVAREATHFVRDVSLFADEAPHHSTRERLDGTGPRLRAESDAQRENKMSMEPKPEPASRPGIKTASVAAAIVIGVAFIVYWPQIKAMLNLG